MPMAPTGAVSRMTTTESISTSRPRSSAVAPSERSTIKSRAVPPTAACTVALGDHATQMSPASRG
eukprot:1886335-Prymnesium_polylepis.1